MASFYEKMFLVIPISFLILVLVFPSDMGIRITGTYFTIITLPLFTFHIARDLILAPAERSRKTLKNKATQITNTYTTKEVL